MADAQTQGYLQNHSAPFTAEKDFGLLMYGADYNVLTDELSVHLKNTGRQRIDKVQVLLEQCSESKAALGSFYGTRNSKPGGLLPLPLT